MNFKSTITFLAFALCAFDAAAQVQINSINTPVVETFAGYTGAGFASAPTAGQLDSDNWSGTNGDDATDNFAFGGTAPTIWRAK